MCSEQREVTLYTPMSVSRTKAMREKLRSCLCGGMSYSTLLTMLMLLIAMDFAWGSSDASGTSDTFQLGLMQQPNPLVGCVMFAFIYYGCIRRWKNPSGTISPVPSVQGDLRSKPYNKAKWFVYMKACCTVGVLIWWLTLDRETGGWEGDRETDGWERDMYVLILKGEIVIVPLLLFTLNKDCRFPEPNVHHWRMKLKLTIFYPIYGTLLSAKLLRYRWNRPYGRNSKLVVFTTRLANATLLFYYVVNVATIADSVLIPRHNCSAISGLMLYVQSVVMLAIVLPVAVTTRHGQLEGYDPIFFLSLANCFLAALLGIAPDKACLVCTENTTGWCYGAWNLENIDKFHFADVLTAW